MHVINARNVNIAYRYGLRLVLNEGERIASRNGPVLRVAEPVSTVYERPVERVLFDRTRHAHPFFHLFEALWMLNGGNDVATMDGFLKSFKQFSDDGVTFHGAYGYRWRHWPVHTTTWVKDLDQIATAILMLRKDPTSRRVVIGMWDPARDLNAESKDIPCNDCIKLWIGADERLHMVVFNRSNDVVWGCYGANAVHMSVLHEYLSAMVFRPQGVLTQISCDFHAYLETPYNVQTFIPPSLWELSLANDPYAQGVVAPYPLVNDAKTFDLELQAMMAEIRERRSVKMFDPRRFTNTFFGDVVIPMHLAWEAVRNGDYQRATTILDGRQSKNDWITAGQQWIAETLCRKAS